MRLIDAEATHRQLAFPGLIEALRRMFVEGCEVPLRHSHRIDGPDGPAGDVLIMPAWRAGRRLGIKTVTIFPGNRAHAAPALHSMYTLFDASTGVPLAQIDGDALTARRTAAASALAASMLARADARRLLVVGAGRVAELLAPAYRAVRQIEQVTVWNRSAAAAQALADRLRGQGFDARAGDDLRSAVGQADIVSCATLAPTALVRGEWLAPGCHLDLIGSFTPQMREADPDCFARSRVFVDTPEALAKAGDLLDAMAAGAFGPSALAGTLAQLCRGEAAGRTSASEITLFKSVGSALEDLAAAELVFDTIAASPPLPR